MTGGMLFAIAGVALFVMGAGGVLLSGHPLRRILAFNVMGSGAFLVLVGLAQRDGTVDPVPQAMVLTGIVVAVAATALALALLRRLHALDGSGELSDVGRVLTRHANPEIAEAVGPKPDLHPNRLTEKNGDA
jgi:multicomponent Na+:H+ antiporter subunit C